MILAIVISITVQAYYTTWSRRKKNRLTLCRSRASLNGSSTMVFVPLVNNGKDCHVLVVKVNKGELTPHPIDYKTYCFRQHSNQWKIPILFQVLNLFLALLLSSFGASNLSAAGGGDDDTNKLTEAFSRIGRFIRWIKRMIFRAFKYFRDRLVDCFRQQMAARRGKIPKLLSLLLLLSSFHKSLLSL